MSKFLFSMATPARCLSVVLSTDETTVSVAIVGEQLTFSNGHFLPPGYWEFTVERAEEVLSAIKEWEALSIFAMVWGWEFSEEQMQAKEGEDEVFAAPIPVTLPDVSAEEEAEEVLRSAA